MYKELFLLSVPVRTQHFDAFWLFLSLYVSIYIYSILLIRLKSPLCAVTLLFKDTTESTTSASYLDLLLSIGRDGQLHTSIYDKRDDFNFHITNFPFLSSNIPLLPHILCKKYNRDQIMVLYC